MVAIGMLNPKTDVEAVTKHIFVEFDGVTDEWLKTLQVETVAGGQLPPNHDEIVRNELQTEGPPEFAATCCSARSRLVRR
jgi:hypothetical protein